LSVLLVEDNPVNQKVAALILKKFGCTAVVANNGAEALALFEPGKYDMILMDVQMPVMDGIETTKQFKSSGVELPPIVGLSANALKSDIDKYLALGMDDYLSKPIVVDDIGKLLAKWFVQTSDSTS
jgi:CheY-like chemotaxis protein